MSVSVFRGKPWYYENLTLAFLATGQLGYVASASAQPLPVPLPSSPINTEELVASGAKGEMTKPPTLRKFVEAKPGLGASPKVGSVIVRLQFTVLQDGSVADVVVVEPGDPVLDAAAVLATEHFKFFPAEVDGNPAPVRIGYEYVYEAREETTPIGVSAAASAPVPAPVELPAAQGSLQGLLLESGTRTPLIGAVVQLPELNREVLTDGQGHFEFTELPVGKLRIVLRDSEHATVKDQEEVRAREVTDIVYYAEPTGYGTDDLVAIGRRHRKEVVRRELSVRELRTVPGSNGDVLKALQNLPGVARTSGDDIVMRGVSNARVLVNGHPILIAFHFGGLRSTVANGMIETLSVTPGNYGARFGDTNGGVVNVLTRRPRTDGVHGYAQMDVFDASVFVEGPVGDYGAVAVGGRRSYIDAILPAVLSDDILKTFSVAPHYYDGQAAYDWKKGRDRFRLVSLASSDKLVFLIDEPDPAEPSNRGEIDVAIRWATTQALWDRRVDENTQLSLGVSYLWSDFAQTFEQVRLNLTNHTVTARADITHRLTPWLEFRTGLDANVQHNRADANIPRPDAEGQPLTVNLTNAEYLTTSSRTAHYNPGAYAAVDVQLGVLAFTTAVRVEHFSRPDRFAGTVAIQPRLNAHVVLAQRTRLKAGVGWYSEAPDLVETNEVFGNPKIEPSRSRHYSAGVEQQLGEAVSVEATGFYQDLYNQTSPSFEPLVNYVNLGAGRVYGGEFLLRHAPSARFYGWLAYTLMRSERKELGEENYRLFDQDQTHNLNIVGQYRLTPTWEFGFRFRFVSGNPTSRVTGAVYDSDGDNYTPLYGAVNDTRIASFHQADVRVDKHWVFDTWKMTTYIDVQNAYNRRNAESLSYNYNYSKSVPAAGLPVIPSFGIKGEF